MEALAFNNRMKCRYGKILEKVTIEKQKQLEETDLKMWPRGLECGFVLLRIEFRARGVAWRRESAKDVGLNHLHHCGIDGLSDDAATIGVSTAVTSTAISTAATSSLQDVFNHLVENIAFHLFALQIGEWVRLEVEDYATLLKLL